MGQKQPKVTAVILNWNDHQRTIKCVQSVAKLDYPNLDILVVDNGSEDESVSVLRQNPDVSQLLSNSCNIGFGAGMNVGVEEALQNGSEYVWILNNDIIIKESEILMDLVQLLETHEDIGIISPLVRRYPETDQVWFAKGEINLTNGSVGHVDVDINDAEERLLETDYLPFCSCLIRADVFRSIGLLPEEYFLYFEDADYCLEARKSGYLIRTDLGNTIYHEVNASSGGQFNPIFSYYRARNGILFSRRHGDESFSNNKYAWWMCKAIIDRLLHRETGSARALLRGIIDGIRGNSGRGPYPE